MKPVRYPDKQLMELLVHQKPRSVGPKVWSRVLEFLSQKLQGMELQTNHEQRISGMPVQTLADWYRKYCDTRGGTARMAYSRRQRQNIRLAFEEIRSLWEPVLVEPLLAVRNYPRAPRRNFVDLRGVREFPKSGLDRMCSIFASSIASHGLFPAPSGSLVVKSALPDSWKAIKFYNVVFGLIANTGVTFSGCFSSFCRLQQKHLPTQAEGELIIPRNVSGDLWLSVTPDEISRITLLGLLCHASRMPRRLGIRRRQMRVMDPEEYLLGEKPTEKIICQLRIGFNQWLELLCRQAGVSGITLETLVQTAQARLPEVYSAEVIASLTCTINYHPLPPDQIRPMNDLLAEFNRERDLPRWESGTTTGSLVKRDPTPKKETNGPSNPKDDEEGGEPTRAYSFDENLIDGLYSICQPYLKEASTGNQLALDLERWGRDCLGEHDPNCELPELIRIHYHQLFQSNLTMEFPLWNAVNIPLIQRWNMACVAGWLAWRLRKGEQQHERIRSMHTFLGYRRDAIALVCANPQSAVTEIGDAEMEEYVSENGSGFYERELSGSQGSMPRRGSVISCWRSLRLYLSRRAGVQLDRASLAMKSEGRRTHYTRLVSEEEMCNLLEICIQRGTPEARCVYLAILLAYFSGLRAIEIVRLRLPQIVMRGDPTLFIQQGKRGKRRNIILDDAPKAFLAILKEERDARRKETGDVNVPLLAFPPTPTSGSQVSQYLQAKKLSRWIVELMNQAGLRSGSLIGELPDLHRLRHSYVNRSFLMRLNARQRRIAERFSIPQEKVESSRSLPINDLKQVSLNAGHTTYTVTLECYIHVLNLLQRDQLGAYQEERSVVFQAAEWLGRRSFEEILSLDHARAHQLMRRSGLCVWREQGQRRMLGIRRRDALMSLYKEIRS